MKEQLYEVIKNKETMILATCANERVTMRTVSPVFYDNKILMFTSSESNKYKQLKINPNCCIYIDNYFIEAKAVFKGSTMLDSNKKLREVYSEKFRDAFDEDASNNGINSEFILLDSKLVTGWNFDGVIPTSPIHIEF